MMEKFMSKKFWVVVILSSILLFHFANNFIWLKQDTVICGPDSGSHLKEATKFHLLFKNILHARDSWVGKAGQLIQAFNWPPTRNWPPLVYFLSALISPQKIDLFSLRLYVNFIFFTLLVLSAYFLGKKCFNRRAGLIAAFLVSFYPAVCAFSRQYQLDFPLLCMTAGSVCLLVYSENFSKRAYSLLFGLSLGMGALIKLQIMFFLLTPLCYAIVGMFRQEKKRRSNGFLNFILSSAIAFSLFNLYWGGRIGDMLENIYSHVFLFYPFYPAGSDTESSVSIPILSLRNFTYYLEGLLWHVYLLPLVLFMCALTGLLMSKHKWCFFYLLSFGVPYLIFSLISVKWIRYILPLLFFMAVVSGWLVDSIRLRSIKILILCLLVFYSTRLFVTLSWTPHRWYYLCPESLFRSTLPDTGYPGLGPPDPFDSTEKLKKAGIIPHMEQRLLAGKTLSIASAGDNSNILVLFSFYFQDEILNKRVAVYDRAASDIFDADYVVIKSRDVLSRKEWFREYRILCRMEMRPSDDELVYLVKK